MTTFLDLLLASGLLELLRLLDSDAEEEQCEDDEEEDDEEEEETELQDEEDDLLRLRLRFLFCLFLEWLLSSVRELELDTLLSGVDIPTVTVLSGTEKTQSGKSAVICAKLVFESELTELTG